MTAVQSVVLMLLDTRAEEEKLAEQPVGLELDSCHVT